MVRNYFTIAIRNHLRGPGYTLISVLGLAIGLTTCILIGMFVRYELSVDAWHDKGDRICTLAQGTTLGDNPRLPTTPERVVLGGSVHPLTRGSSNPSNRSRG